MGEGSTAEHRSREDADRDWLDGEPDAGRELEDHGEDQGAEVPGAANLDHHRGGLEAEKEEAQVSAAGRSRLLEFRDGRVRAGLGEVQE